MDISVMRRDLMASVAGTAGAFGLGSAGDVSALESLENEDVSNMNGEPVELTLKGSAQPVLVTTEKEHQALVSTFSGSVEGTFTGGYNGQQVALVYRKPAEDGHDDHDHHGEFTTDTAKVGGVTTLSVPDNEVASVSTYKIAAEGWITKCCGKNNFEYEGQFQSIEATGRFAGTKLKGKITSKTDLGFPQRLKIKGVRTSE